MLQAGIFIFFLRIFDISLYTMRIMMVMRGRKGLAWGFAFCQALGYIFAIRGVLSGLNNPATILGYSGGFATGLVAGILLENRLAIGYTHLRVVSRGYGEELAVKLRQAGHAVTEISGRGRDGMVSVLSIHVLRKREPEVVALISAADPAAFVTAQNVNSRQHGYWHI